MNKSLLWRGVLILAVVVTAIASAYPVDETINLGLDLRGGIHLVLEVQVPDALRSESDRDIEAFLQEARDQGLTAVAANRTSDSSFDVTGVDPARDSVVDGVAADYLPGWTWTRRGERLSFDMTLQNVNEIRELAVVQAEQTIRNRVDAFGVAEPVIQRQGIGGSRIVVQLPGVDDPERVKRLIKNTAFLEFRLVDYPLGGGCSPSRDQVLASYGAALPDNLEIIEQDVRAEDGRVIDQNYCAVEKRPVVTGRDLKDARPGLGQFNQPVVNFSLTHEGGQLFGEATGANIGRGLAIVLDGNIVTAPNIRSRIDDRGLIEGSFTPEEAQDLSTVLRSGALPAAITYLEERTVGPSLGQDSIDQGLKAGLIGAVLVVLTILIVYRLTGHQRGARSDAQHRVDLRHPGVLRRHPDPAGHRRHRPDDRHGGGCQRPGLRAHQGGAATRPDCAVGRGLRILEGLSSILDANITTLIAALFLFQFGTGPIRGFAVTLSIGILASLFTAIFVSRWLFDIYLSRGQRDREALDLGPTSASIGARRWRFSPTRNIDFMKYRKGLMLFSVGSGPAERLRGLFRRQPQSGHRLRGWHAADGQVPAVAPGRRAAWSLRRRRIGRCPDPGLRSRGRQRSSDQDLGGRRERRGTSRSARRGARRGVQRW